MKTSLYVVLGLGIFPGMAHPADRAGNPPLLLQIGQTPLTFADTNQEARVFNTGSGMAIFHDISGLVVSSAVMAKPVMLPASSAVIYFEGPPEGPPEQLSLARASARPAASNNSVESTVALVKLFYAALGSNPACAQGYIDADRKGKQLFDKYGGSWPADALPAANTLQGRHFSASLWQRCGDIAVGLGLIGQWPDGAAQNAGFDVSIYVESLVAHDEERGRRKAADAKWASEHSAEEAQQAKEELKRFLDGKPVGAQQGVPADRARPAGEPGR
ncbi:hypothetical protein [Nevskia ramosa]|uniref:hypothetical protein n=1 Tax=Nevskia ramosa TaxID=64002 RepID=UPI003D0F1789